MVKCMKHSRCTATTSLKLPGQNHKLIAPFKSCLGRRDVGKLPQGRMSEWNLRVARVPRVQLVPRYLDGSLGIIRSGTNLFEQ